MLQVKDYSTAKSDHFILKFAPLMMNGGGMHLIKLIWFGVGSGTHFTMQVLYIYIKIICVVAKPRMLTQVRMEVDSLVLNQV